MMFVRLQPYKECSSKCRSQKLKPHFYKTYRILRRIDEVVYELELPDESKIHNVFHVSCLTRAVGKHIVSSDKLPLLDEGEQILIPKVFMDMRERKLRNKRNKSTKDYLVRWKDLPIEHATWEPQKIGASKSEIA